MARTRAPSAPAKPKIKPAWREILTDGKRAWVRLAAGAGAGSSNKKADALRALARHGSGAVSEPKGFGKWQSTGGDNRHRKHKDYASPHKPPKRRQG